MLKKSIKRLINKLGYDIHSLQHETNKISQLRRAIGESYILIRELGFSPNTVIDIGVAGGTPELYDTFPDSYFLLIEPLKEFEPDLISILNRHKGSYVMAAAGSSSGFTTFNLHKNHLEGSSLYKESMGSDADGSEVEVPLIRIDDIIKDKQLTGPYLIKVDV